VFLLLGLFAHYFARASEAAERSVREQHDRAEALLHAILPVPIADRLKRSRGIIADGFPTASVLFADLVGFTVMSSELPPERIVAMLDDLFSDFDALVDARGLEKIKTIGDAYMVAAGVPAPRDAHAEALAELALEMRAAVERRHRATGLPLRMRIGIHSGPVVAGVIGRRKFVYDLWGDTVNTAARMESHGVPGEIQLSRATRDLLGEGFELEARGEIPIKGKGSMEVFLLRGRRDAPAAS
jgi:guanylate cyclase